MTLSKSRSSKNGGFQGGVSFGLLGSGGSRLSTTREVIIGVFSLLSIAVALVVEGDKEVLVT